MLVVRRVLLCGAFPRADTLLASALVSPSLLRTGGSRGSLPPAPPKPRVSSRPWTTSIPHNLRALVQTSFSRSSGPGGQNVNKLSTKAEVRFKLADAAWLPADARERLAAMWPSHVTSDGEVFVSSQKHRTQEANLTEAMEKLEAMVMKAAVPPKVRQLRTNLSELTKKTYREDKRRHSEVKQRRGAKPSWDGADD